MTEEQREACEKLAESYPAYYEMRYMNADTPRLSGAEYLKHGYKAGYQAAQTPEMLLLNPIVKDMYDQLNRLSRLLQDWPYNGPRINKALAPFGKSDAFKEGE